jgi:hypothetical protein
MTMSLAGVVTFSKPLKYPLLAATTFKSVPLTVGNENVPSAPAVVRVGVACNVTNASAMGVCVEASITTPETCATQGDAARASRATDRAGINQNDVIETRDRR